MLLYQQSYYERNKEALKEKAKQRWIEEKERRNLPLATIGKCEFCKRKYVNDIYSVRHKYGCKYSKNLQYMKHNFVSFVRKGEFKISI